MRFRTEFVLIQFYIHCYYVLNKRYDVFKLIVVWFLKVNELLSAIYNDKCQWTWETFFSSFWISGLILDCSFFDRRISKLRKFDK